MKKLGMGLIGPGFVAPYHIEAVRRLGDVEVVGIAGSSRESAEHKAAEFKVEKAYGDYEELILDPDIDVVHNTAPNHLHFSVCMTALEAGKHVICDKPLAITPEEAQQLRDRAVKSGLANVVLFNYRGNPLIQQARFMVKQGEIGRVQFVNGVYFQDWMADAGIYSWRYDSLRAGRSFAIADIGTHLCDLAQHVSGSLIDSVLADLTTVIPVRYTDGPEEHTFTHTRRMRGEPKHISGEDLASVLLRFETGAKGCFSVGQVLPGHKNDLQLEVCGRSGSLRWLQEQPNELWVGRYGEPNQVITKDPDQLVESALHYTHFPAGHQSGWADAIFNVVSDAYDWIRAGADPSSQPTATATFDDGYRVCCIVDAMVSSHAAGGVWQKVSYVPHADPVAIRG
jgi:predicted dehydrogenase